MKSKSRLRLIPKLLALLLSFWIYPTQLALASTYGSRVYGTCQYQAACLPPKSFLSKYGWIIAFAALILSALLWLIILLARRRKKDQKKNNLLPPTTPVIKS